VDGIYRLIKTQYENSGGDSIPLFQTIIEAAEEVGMKEALTVLEDCVMEKRLAWIDRQLGELPLSGYPVQDGFNVFFERYLGLSVPRDGEIVEASPKRIVVRWWNPCPTLDACVKLGLDTRQVCRCAYQQPVEALLRCVDPRLRFERNYEAIRPYALYCEEIISLEGE
jgi:hypothetical protein